MTEEELLLLSGSAHAEATEPLASKPKGSPMDDIVVSLTTFIPTLFHCYADDIQLYITLQRPYGIGILTVIVIIIIITELLP